MLTSANKRVAKNPVIVRWFFFMVIHHFPEIISDGPPPILGRSTAVLLFELSVEERGTLVAESDGDGGGAIVNLSSIMGSVAAAGGASYVAGKHGVIGLSKVTALDYGKQGLRCNAIGPGVIDTPMTRGAIQQEAVFEALQSATPVGRLGKAEDIAALAVFLCSRESTFINGAYYPIDGGDLCQ